MQSFGKAVRNALPALGLGLMAATGLATVTAVTAPAAYAQAKAKKEFVENYNAAQEALKTKNWAVALQKADAAFPHAADNPQKSAVWSVRIAANHGAGKKADLIKAIEGQMALGGLDAATTKRHRESLMGLYAEVGNETKAAELIRAYVGDYGGTSTQYAWLAQRALSAKSYDDAVSNATKAIDASRKEGKKPSDRFYNIKLNAYVGKNDMPGYYKTLEEVAPLYPKDIYFRPLIDRAAKDPKFSRQAAQLDIYRAYIASGIELKPEEKVLMAEQAFARAMAVEAETIIDPLVKAGQIGGATDKNAERNKRLIASITTAAKEDKAGGLAASEREAAAAPTGAIFVATGESYLGMGDFAKAADLIKKGLDKGQLTPEEEAFARLRLGVAQFRAGQKDAARSTWGEIKAENGAESLAKAWIAISRT